MNEIRIYAEHTKPVFELRPSASGAHFLSYGLDGTMRLWEIGNGRQIAVFPLADTIVFSLDDTKIIRAGEDSDLYLLDVETQHELHKFCGHTGSVRCVAISPDGKQVLSGGNDGTLRLWDLDSGLELYREELGCSVTGVDFSPTGDSALCCLDSCDVLEYDPRRGQVIRHLAVHEQDEMNGITYSPGGSYGLYCGAFGGVIDLRTGKEIGFVERGAELSAPRRGTSPNFAFSRDDQLMATGQFRGVVEMWQTRPQKSLRRIETGATWAYCVAFSPSDDTLLCATDRSMHLFQIETGAELCRFPETPSHANWAGFLPAGKGILTAHGSLVLDETGQWGLKRDGEYVYHDNVVRLWSVGRSGA